MHPDFDCGRGLWFTVVSYKYHISTSLSRILQAILDQGKKFTGEHIEPIYLKEIELGFSHYLGGKGAVGDKVEIFLQWVI